MEHIQNKCSSESKLFFTRICSIKILNILEDIVKMLNPGQGHPVDAIDQSCHDFATCYNCLYSKEIGRECEESDTGNYRMTGRNNPVTGEKTLSCSKFFF